jgi:DNA-directed RNA polymerase specialized sigma24 family protein
MDVQESFDAYVRARGAALFRVAYLLSGDHHLAEDLVQSALLRTAGHWRRVVASGDPDGLNTADPGTAYKPAKM